MAYQAPTTSTSMTSPSQANHIPTILVEYLAPTPPVDHPNITQPVNALASATTIEQPPTPTSVGPHITSQHIPNTTHDMSLSHPQPTLLLFNPANNTHSMTTRAKHGIIKLKIPTDGTTKYPLPHAPLTEANLDFVEPTCYSFTIKHS